MKKYTKPNAKIVAIDALDIIQTSIVVGDGDFTGGGSTGSWSDPVNLTATADIFEN